MRLLVAIAALYAAGLAARTPPPHAPRWEVHRAVPQIMDMVGPRSDGRFVVATYRDVRLLGPGGRLRTLAAGLATSHEVEPHVALARPQRVPGAGCAWRRDDVYLTGPAGHRQVFRIGARGGVRRFAPLPPDEVPSGIGYDEVGRFGHRLLVLAIRGEGSVLHALDCRGRVSTIARHLEYAEGGLVVAPRSFGAHAGEAIVVNEYTDHVIAIRPDGTSGVLAVPPLPRGRDLGPESVGFVPAGLGAGDRVLVADRHFPDQPPHGNQAVMAIDAGRLRRSGVRTGDLLVATEARLRLAVVRCRPVCSSWVVARPNPVGHGESPIVFAPGG